MHGTLRSGGTNNDPVSRRASSRHPLARSNRLAHRRSALLRPLVLAPAASAGLPHQHIQPCTTALEMVRSHPLHPRLRHRMALHLGLRLNRPRHARTHGSTHPSRRRRPVSLCAQPHVPWLLHWLARPLDRLWTRQPRRHHHCLLLRPLRPLVRALLRRATPAQDLRRRLRRILPPRLPLATPAPPLAKITP